MAAKKDKNSKKEFEERVVSVNRCSKVVKGGRRFSFSALVVVGDRKGHVGYGYGKANEVTDAIRKGTDLARRDMFPVVMKDDTLPHEALGKVGGGEVLVRPASPGTGVIAGGPVRAILELAGIRDVLAKSLGSKSPINVTKATVAALKKMRTRDEVLELRKQEGITVEA